MGAESKMSTVATRHAMPAPRVVEGTREHTGELVGKEGLCPSEDWGGPESCLRKVRPYERLWLLAPS